MAKFYDEIWEVLNSGDLNFKFGKFDEILKDFKDGKFELNSDEKAKPLENPSYAKFTKVVQMRDLKKQKNRDIEFLHSIAHIEYSAIDIALDACYRFRNLPKEYYLDWLVVADEEIRHFKMISDLLAKFDTKYGDLIVHNGLFIALQKTENSLLERMAVLPRYMEANGLDANYFLINKIKNDPSKSELLSVLRVILEEEVDHVKKGDRWFKFEASRVGLSNLAQIYIDIVTKHYPKAFLTSRELNEVGRKMAGFSQDELELIKNFKGN